MGQHDDRPATYRADVQGLRALSVLLVVASHAAVPGLAGGYVGVDVFFVISGYLLTGLLIRARERTGQFGVVDFFTRRALRILPAATLVTLVTLAASVVLLPALRALEVAEDARWAALFLANVRFADTGADYFATDLDVSPLRHLWSLAVEEQVYLVLPLLLVLAARGAGAGRVGRVLATVRRRSVLALAVAGTASLVWAVLLTERDPGAAYFSTPARAWEVAAGGLLAAAAPRWAPLLTTRARGLLTTLGVGTIVLAAVAYDASTPFPGAAALLPVAGAVLVVLAGADRPPAQGVARSAALLGSAPMRVVGDWSFSLYLWHWPVLVLLRAERPDPEPWLVAAALAVVVVLAAATHRWVEEPFRRRRPWARAESARFPAESARFPAQSAQFPAQSARFPAQSARIRRGQGLVLYPLSLTLIAPAALLGTAVVEQRLAERGDAPAIAAPATPPGPSGPDAPDDGGTAERTALVRASVAAVRQGRPVPGDLTPDLLAARDDVPEQACDYGGGSRSLCPLGDVGAERTVVVLGDSHGLMWQPALDQAAAEAGVELLMLVRPRCTPLPVEQADYDALGLLDAATPEAARDLVECADFRAFARSVVEDVRPDVLVVSTSPFLGTASVGGAEDDLALVSQRWRDLLDDLAPLAGRTVLLRDVPRAAEDPVTCLATPADDLGDCPVEPTGYAEAVADASVVAAREAGAEVVDPRPWLCDGGLCAPVVGATLTWRDDGHLTATYAGELAGPLGAALDLGR